VWTGAGRLLPFDAVVVAVPPRPQGDGFVARPIVDVHLWHDRGGLGLEFAALLGSPVQWVFEKAPGYLCCSLSDAGAVVRRPERELVELAWGEVSGAVPGLAGAALCQGAATRSPAATYAPLPGVRRPGPATAARNVVRAGSWTDTGWPDTMESAVRSGGAAARLLKRRLQEVASVT
jgi:hypothetical protein